VEANFDLIYKYSKSTIIEVIYTVEEQQPEANYLFYCINPTCFHEIKKATVLFLLEQNQSENPQCMNALSHFFVKSIAKWRSRSWINL